MFTFDNLAGPLLTPADLESFIDLDVVKAQQMIDDALADALVEAPCLRQASAETLAAAKGLIRRAIVRWAEAGSGTVTQVSALSFSQSIDTRGSTTLFYPSEARRLRALCRSGGGKAFSIDTAPAW